MTNPVYIGNDSFVRDAERFGIEVPSGYGCVTGCSICRNFRNAVRAERAKLAAEEAEVVAERVARYRLGYDHGWEDGRRSAFYDVQEVLDANA